MPADDFKSILDYTRNILLFFKENGICGFEGPAAIQPILEKWSSPPPNQAVESSADQLKRLQSEIGICKRCGFSETRQHLLFGQGNPEADLVFVLDHPREAEDRMSDFFSGEAGTMLARMLAAMKLRKDQVYVCSVLKCRPSNPISLKSTEVETCVSFIKKQIQIIQPRFICAMGDLAARSVLVTSDTVEHLRRRYHLYQNIKVFPTYHPSYLLQYPEKKGDTWQDLQLLMQEMEKSGK